MEDFLQRIEQTEKDNFGGFSWAYAGINIVTTRDYPGSKVIDKATSEKQFKPNLFFRILLVLFALGFLVLAVWETFSNQKSPLKDILIINCLAVMIIIAVIKQFFFNKKLNYTITINTTGISIDERIFLWKDIYSTAIATKGSGKNRSEYLLIAMKDLVTYEMFDLSQFADLNFDGFSATLSAYIEYFKPWID